MEQSRLGPIAILKFGALNNNNLVVMCHDSEFAKFYPLPELWLAFAQKWGIMMVKQLKNHKSIFGHPNPTHAVELLQKKNCFQTRWTDGTAKGRKS